MEEEKLQILADHCGFDDPLDLLEATLCDSVSPGICRNRYCDYFTDVEPDSCTGWCEACGTATVISAGVLAGIV